MLKWYRTAVLGWRYPINNNDVEFGTAVHLFIKIMYETGGDFSKALFAALDYFERTKMNIKEKKQYLNRGYLQKVCLEYWTDYLVKDDFEILTVNGKPAVEVTFSNQVYEDDNWIILLEGTIDKIGKFKNGCYAIGDYKTTASWDREEYLRAYKLKTQLRFYLLNLRLHCSTHPDSVLNEVIKLPTGCFIDGIFHNGASKTIYERSDVFVFSDNDMKMYEIMLQSFIQEVIGVLNWCKSNGAPPPPQGMLNDACGENFGCAFRPICGAPDLVASEMIFNRDFVVKPYEPLKFGKE